MRIADIVLSSDDRTFEQKHGERCPFCNRTWDDRNSCAPVDPGWTWREQMDASFRNRNRRPVEIPRSDRVCVRCLTVYQGMAGQLYCSKRCLDQAKTARYRAAHATTKDCAECGLEYEGKPSSSFCSLSCSNRSRQTRRREALAAGGQRNAA